MMKRQAAAVFIGLTFIPVIALSAGLLRGQDPVQGTGSGRQACQVSEIIPDEWRIRWDPGIPGGIPEITGPVENIVDHGADPTGMSACQDAIYRAMDALPPGGGVVFIPEGTFMIDSSVIIGRDRVVFRGTGKGSKIVSEAEGDCFQVIIYRRGAWQALPLGASRGAMKVTVGDGSVFTPGKFAEIEQDNDSLLMYTDTAWIVPWGESSVGQVLEVDSVLGNEVVFRSPVHFDFTAGLNARIRWQDPVKWVGFEKLYIEKRVAEGSMFTFKNTAYCWIRDIESYRTRNTHVNQHASLGNEFRDSYFHNSFSYGGGGSGYGVACGFHVTSSLVENNVFDSLRHAMIIQQGANGNVYGYNYSLHPVQGDSGAELNLGWIPPDVSIHGHYPYMNLFEGNEAEEIGIGDFWGPAGPGNTYFRNRVNGDGIIYMDASHGQNVIGNVTTVLEEWGDYHLEKVEHGNVVGGMVAWDPGIADRELPDSYYLDSVPAFFRLHSWPPFGPDVSPGNRLPAEIRFRNLPYLDVEAGSDSAGRYEKLEFTIDNGKGYSNPFDPDEVDVSGRFVSPSGDTVKVNAFWDGSWWKLRFAGRETGRWSYAISVTDAEGSEERSGEFHITGSDLGGWIAPSPRDPHYLACDDGSPFYGVGMAVPWLVYDSLYYEQPGLLKRLKGYGVNMINWLFTSWDVLLLRDSYETYSMEDAGKFDRLIEDAGRQGIRLLLGIWIHDLLRDAPHPWDGFYDWKSNPFRKLTGVDGFFSDSASWEYQKKYYRYIIARWGYSPAIGMWHTVAEIDGTNAIYDPLAMTGDEEGWHARINRYFIENDPFGHPTSVSGSGGFDFSDGWDLTRCPQAHEYPYPPENLEQNPDRIAYWSDRLSRAYEKPCLIGEFGKSLYEEGKSESFLHNGIWAGLMAGACATPLHWWGGRIDERPGNFSTFSGEMMDQLKYLKLFTDSIDMAAHHFSSLYGAPPGQGILVSGMPGGKAYGLRGDSVGICWVYHVDETSSGEFSGVVLSFPGLPEGRYGLSFYDPWNGAWYGEEAEAGTAGGTLAVACPDFTGDLAVKIRYLSPLSQDSRHAANPGACRVFPNPCVSCVHVENLDRVRSLRLMSASGQILAAAETGQQERVTFGLQGCSRGILLLEIRYRNGHTETVRLVHL